MTLQRLSTKYLQVASAITYAFKKRISLPCPFLATRCVVMPSIATLSRRGAPFLGAMFCLPFNIVLAGSFSPPTPPDHSSSSPVSERLGADLVYTCTDQNGRKTFTDRGCKESEHLHAQAPSTQSFVAFPPLTQSEQLILEELAAATERAIAQRRGAQRLSQKKANQDQKRREQLCDNAKAELRALARQRRAGYDADEHAHLEAAKRKLNEQKQINC